MEMKLNTLSIRNFKGIKEYKLDPQGESINVMGDNGTGKTTLYDAFLWLLFGKNSENQANFDWKPLDAAGNEIHHLETEVIAELEFDGKVKTLSRMTEESWVKKRGSAAETFSGHNSTYKIDELEVTMKEYNEFINERVEERLFKILTDISFFSTDKMEYKKGKKTIPAWKARRETLIGMVGDITDLDVISKSDELGALKPLIEERPVDELKQLTGQNMGQINKQIKELPNRIDEVDRSLPDISKYDEKMIHKERDAADKRVSELQEEIAELRNSDEAVALKGRMAELRMAYREAELEYNQKADEPLQDLREQRSKLQNQKAKTDAEISDVEHLELNFNQRLIEEAKNKIEGIVRRQDELREKFFEVQNKKMAAFEEHQKTCPTCGQDLTEEKILNLRFEYEKEVEAFNNKQAEKLKNTQKEGKALSEQVAEQNEIIEKISEQNKEHEATLELLKEQQRKEQYKLDKINESIEEIASGQNKFIDTAEAKEVQEQINKLEENLKNAQGSKEEDIEKLQEDIKEFRGYGEQANKKLRDIEFYNQQAQRKEELIEQEQKLSIEYGKQEQIQHLLDIFTRTKVDLLTNTINDKFEIVKFKLFEEQVNGALNEVCETTVNGANYSTGLNNAAKINAGLDIIATLMKHYDTWVPVWIDNAESINDILEIDTQIITLAVSKHKNLRVEATEKTNQKENNK